MCAGRSSSTQAQPTSMAKSRRVGVLEAKTHLSQLLRDVENGDDIILLRAGKPVARITRLEHARPRKSSYGIAKGKFVMSDDFEAGSDELADLFGIPR